METLLHLDCGTLFSPPPFSVAALPNMDDHGLATSEMDDLRWPLWWKKALDVLFSLIMDPWKILPDDQARYDQQFLQLNPVDGFITGQQARDFLLKANLPHPVLAKVWELSDINRDGKLDKREFSIAMHLIRKKLQGNLRMCLKPRIQNSWYEDLPSFLGVPLGRSSGAQTWYWRGGGRSYANLSSLFPRCIIGLLRHPLQSFRECILFATEMLWVFFLCWQHIYLYVKGGSTSKSPLTPSSSTFLFYEGYRCPCSSFGVFTKLRYFHTLLWRVGGITTSSSALSRWIEQGFINSWLFWRKRPFGKERTAENFQQTLPYL